MKSFMHHRFISLFTFALIALVFALQPSIALASPSEYLHNRHSSSGLDDADTCSSSDVAIRNSFSNQPRVDSPITLGDFINWVRGDGRRTVRGVYVCGKLTVTVEQQPDNNPFYVSNALGAVTQFRPAAQYGTLALLAHNDLSGKQFFNLQIGDEVDIVYNDGSIRRSVISEVRHFHALEPENPYTSFIDLENNGMMLSSTQVFQQIFASGDRVVFQTCIEGENSRAWGRLFVIATPLSTN